MSGERNGHNSDETAIQVVVAVAGTAGAYELTFLGDTFQESREWEAHDGKTVRQLQSEADTLHDAAEVAGDPAVEQANNSAAATKNSTATELQAKQPEHTGVFVEGSALIACAGIGVILGQVAKGTLRGVKKIRHNQSKH